MGCRESKDDVVKLSFEDPQITQMEHVDYKSRLERKICVAKETPEPEYDLSDCNLKKIPNGVFIVCKVLRKEQLILRNNQLNSLSSLTGGSVNDLELLNVLDLSHNKFTEIPIALLSLKNLRELFFSHNLLNELPGNIIKLNNLELLDISFNNLSTIDKISCMLQLKVLNISGNKMLKQLPVNLSTCESLTDIVFDESIVDPPQDVLSSGTVNILKFLSTGEKTFDFENVCDRVIKTQTTIINHKRQINTEDEKSKAIAFLEQERMDQMSQNQLLHKEQQRKKNELMLKLLDQQDKADTTVLELQLQKDIARKKLLDNIMEYEQSANFVFDQLLELKKGPDANLLEQENRDREQLLKMAYSQKQHHEQELRRMDILSAMSGVIDEELIRIKEIQNMRDASSKCILDQETESNVLLNSIFLDHERDRAQIVDKIMNDENLQKTALTTLLNKNDAHQLGLVQQIRIVETQLAIMTKIDIEKKKTCNDRYINDLADKRINLTFLLLDLMNQQDQRKKQLLDTIKCMQDQTESKDFWLLAYQKLLDSQPADLRHLSIEPELSYKFLLNGVVHILPFLVRILKNIQLGDISTADLENAGVKNVRDRDGVLKAIQEYLTGLSCSKKLEEIEECLSPSAPPRSSASPESVTASFDNTFGPSTVSSAECVICMDDSVQIIFVLCGHMCCCGKCQVDLIDCPICRNFIEKKIRVIQP